MFICIHRMPNRWGSCILNPTSIYCTTRCCFCHTAQCDTYISIVLAQTTTDSTNVTSTTFSSYSWQLANKWRYITVVYFPGGSYITYYFLLYKDSYCILNSAGLLKHHTESFAIPWVHYQFILSVQNREM